MRGTLLADGPTDRLLLPVIRWLLGDLGAPPVELRWADPGLFRANVTTLADKALEAIDLDPCDVLFIHRDAEKVPLGKRVAEIREALESASLSVPYVCVVPIRMTEAWFLFDEGAIRRAASNPHGRCPLDLPPLENVERAPDPKAVLRSALMGAAELRGRHLRRFKRNLGRSVHRVGELIDDYSPLRCLSAFQAFEADIKKFLDSHRTVT